MSEHCEGCEHCWENEHDGRLSECHGLIVHKQEEDVAGPRADGCGGRCGAFAVADASQCELENDHEGKHRMSSKERCVGRKQCWGDDYACDECTDLMFSAEQVMARFDNLVERLKNIQSELLNLSPNIHQMTDQKKEG